jgi:two-component system sensor histidine kinase RegB
MYFYIPLPGTEHAAPMTTLFAQGADMQHAEMHIHGAEQGSFSMHVVGMWLNFMFSAAVIAFFVQRIAASLRERERELAAAREETLRNERIVALGTLAAGTAHELGTPLATVAVVAKDLQEEYANDPELGPQLGLIRGQIDLCKGVLSKIVAASGQLQAGETRNVPLDRAVSELMEQWGLLRPGVRAKVGRVAAESAILRVDGTLEQALLNLLNNAADASPSGLV